MPELAELNPTGSNSQVDVKTSIPKAKFAPEPEETPDYKLETPNYADNKETVAKVVGWLKSYVSDFESRGQWKTFQDNCDVADELMRAAVNRVQLDSDESKNVEDTRSNVKSATFAVSMRAITAGEQSVILGNQEEIPVECEPLAEAAGALEEEGAAMADNKNAWMSYVMERDDVRTKLGKTLFRINKYGNQPVEMFWDYRKSKKKIKIQLKKKLDGDVVLTKKIKGKSPKPKDFVFVEREMTLADYPSIRQHDVKDFLYDVAIDDMQRQSCYKIREQYQLGELWQLQRTNLLKGVGDVKLSQLYQGEGSSKSDKDMLEDRQSNAGELTDADSPTTLFDVHRGHIRVPINDESGKWDSDSELPHWYEYWFVGDINANPKCVRLAPHWDDEIPVDVIHSHDDDKGGIHMMYVNLVKSYMAQEMTSIDQYFDNVTERNQAPWIMEPGAVRIRSFLSTASHNRVWVKKPGVPIPEIVDVQDTTLQTSTMIGFIQEQINKAMGTNKPFLGEALGSRTSASEAITDFEQALKPALRDAAYKSGQLLPFYAKWVDRMTELFADPNTVVLITYNGQTQELKPAELCGPMRYRVVSIKKFQDNAIRERQEVQFMSQYFAIAAPLMGKLAQIPLKQIAVNRQYEHVETWFPKLAADKDAQNVAKSENQQITLEGVIDQPDKDENHEAHLAKHEPYLASINIMTTEQQEQIGATDQNIANLKLHIQTHETMMAEEAQSAQAAGSAAQGAAPAEPTLPGEQAGDDLAAAAGAEAIGGRPPDIEGAGLI